LVPVISSHIWACSRSSAAIDSVSGVIWLEYAASSSPSMLRTRSATRSGPNSRASKITRRTRTRAPEIGGTFAPACSSRDAQISA
jgi:hypothetical protein